MSVSEGDRRGRAQRGATTELDSKVDPHLSVHRFRLLSDAATPDAKQIYFGMWPERLRWSSISVGIALTSGLRKIDP